MAALTLTQWNARMAKLPREDRMSYDEYLKTLPVTPAPDVKVTPVAPKPVVTTPTPTPAPATPAPATGSSGSIGQKLAAEAAAKKAADDKATKDKADAKAKEDKDAKDKADAEKADADKKAAAEAALAKSAAEQAAVAAAKATAVAKAKAAADKVAADKAALDDAAAKEARRVFDAKNVAFKAKENLDNANNKVAVAQKVLDDAKTDAETQAALDALHLATVKAKALLKVQETAAKARQDAIDEAAKLATAEQAIADAKTAATAAAALEAYNKAEADRNALEATNQAAIDAARIATNAKSIADTVANSRIDSAGNVEYFNQEKADALSGKPVITTDKNTKDDTTAAETLAAAGDVAADNAMYATAAGTGSTVVKTRVTKYTDKFGNVKDLDKDFNQIPFDELPENIKKNIIDNAKLNNMTPEAYYAMRGGVNKSGYFGDAYGVNSQTGVSLTDEEYAAAIKGKSGAVAGTAVNAAQDAKVLEVTGNVSPAAAGNAETAVKAADAAATEANKVLDKMADPNDPATLAAKAAAKLIKDAEDKAAALLATAETKAKAVEDALKAKNLPSTNIDVLKSLLKGMGFNSKIIDSSSSFLMKLLSEGLDYDNAVSIFLDSKDYTLKDGTKVTSPFYEQYGYLNEGMTNAKSASELYNFVEGSKGIIEKYGLSQKFLSPDSLKKYVKNNVTAKDLDERANAARLKAINADPAYVQSLKMLGYLGASSDLTDFYLDPAIGKEKLESNRNTGAFTAEALRRASSGIQTDREDLGRFERLTAGLQAKGLNEAQISQTAGEGFENIANTLQPEVGLSNIFEGKNAANAKTIQSELEAEQFSNMASARRKKLKELGTNIMNESSGNFQGRITSYSNASTAGAI